MIAPMQASAGKQVTFGGHAENHRRQIVPARLSLEDGGHLAACDVSDPTDELWVHRTSSCTSKRSGFHRLLLRLANDEGAAGPLADAAEFASA